MPAFLIAALLWLGLLSSSIAQAPPAILSDNAESIAVVVGNKAYKQTSTVDFAHNDAEAIKAYLTGTLGFREQNVFLLKDATLGELRPSDGPAPDEAVQEMDIRARLEAAVKLLPEQEQKVIAARFGAGGELLAPGERIERKLGVTAKEARELEARALARLAEMGELQDLREAA